MIYGDELKAMLDAPVQMLDRMEYTEDGAIGHRLISANEMVFQGHFPGAPVLPGVLQVAAMAQISKLCWLKEYPGVQPCLLELSRVKFRTPVTPGAAMRIECAIAGREEGKMSFQVKNFLGEDLASSGNIVLGAMPGGWLEPLDNSGAKVPEGELLSSIEIMKHIPHRFPFMLLDGAYGMGTTSPDTGMVELSGYKNITCNDPLVKSCFPGYLQVEAGAQLGCLALLSKPENADKLGFFMSIDEAHFYHGVTPGDRLDISISIEPRGRFGIASGTMSVGATKVSEA
ncbi:MAG: hypothetical protein IKS20_00910, partial [Victivallales bacterium]|nr:hypothetical protein [Victivallales bacterium]